MLIFKSSGVFLLNSRIGAVFLNSSVLNGKYYVTKKELGKVKQLKTFGRKNIYINKYMKMIM